VRILGLSLVVASAAALLSACGGGPTSSSAPSTTTTAHGAQPRLGFVAVDGVVATARAPVPVYASVHATSPSSTLPAQTPFGSPTTMLVVAREHDWLEVSLPTRPNGSTGFVRASAVDLGRFDHRVDIDLTAGRLQVGDASGQVVVDTPVAIGSPQNPTPTGRFYVTDVIDTESSGGAYGPFALGLSAHSDTLNEFAGGDGEIGIHGTNEPASIGNAVSHGCVRVPNSVVRQIAGMLALGTPVTIHGTLTP
jgi:lipoprotein-anchoring transpeptidase ErfK/SrfK